MCCNKRKSYSITAKWKHLAFHLINYSNVSITNKVKGGVGGMLHSAFSF